MPATSQEAATQASLTGLISSYSFIELIQTVENLKTASSFLLDHCFPNEVMSQAAEVAIDIDVGKRRMSPFVSPLVEGRPVESRQFQTNLYVPPTVKDFRNPDLLKPLRRQFGERIGGDVSLRNRVEENIRYEFADQIDMLNRRCEWMAAQALTSGKVEVTGDGYESHVIDYQRDPSLTIALTGDAQWGRSGVSPTDDLSNWAIHVLQKSGSMPQEIYFSVSAWRNFVSDPKLRDYTFQRALIDPRSEQIALGGRLPKKGGIYMGPWDQFDLYLYADWYVDVMRNPDGSVMKDANGRPIEIERPMIPEGTVILSGPDLQGTRAYGVVQDPEFNYQPLAYAPKLWCQRNPGQINMMMQSAPLMIPSRVNASMSISVCAPGNGITGGTN
ncbi:major capsid protein [Bombella apis]|uniref:major capsid protein n=1 Tax=Bombella apis TaxID=1785988 RepID=UPI0024A977AA|nr:major capsid protein [Bombella apis]